MKKAILFSAVACLGMMLAASCGSKNTNEVEVAEALSVDTVVANPEAFLGDTVTIEGVVSHLCKHGGKKAFVLGADENTMIRCEATPEMGGAFPQESIHKPIRVTGVVSTHYITTSIYSRIRNPQISIKNIHTGYKP